MNAVGFHILKLIVQKFPDAITRSRFWSSEIETWKATLPQASHMQIST